MTISLLSIIKNILKKLGDLVIFSTNFSEKKKKQSRKHIQFTKTNTDH